MTLNTRLQLRKEVTSINGKLFTAKRKQAQANLQGEGRKELKATINVMEIEAQAQALEQTLNASSTCTISIISNQITLHALKVASRGRQLKDKKNKPLKDENGNVRMTPANLIALKILQAGINDTSGILDDLRQSVACEVWQAYTENRVSIVETETINNETSKRISYSVKIQLADKTDKTTLRQIYNVVQNYLYSNLQKHFKRQYKPVIDENGNELTELVTKAIRDYELGLQSQDKNELFQELQAILNESESALLWAMYDTKEVERVTTTQRISDSEKTEKTHESKKTIVSRKKTLSELSQETGFTIQTVRTLQKHIKAKLTEIIEENNNKYSKRTHQNSFTSSTSLIKLASTHITSPRQKPTKEDYTSHYCKDCTQDCTDKHISGLQCSINKTMTKKEENTPKNVKIYKFELEQKPMVSASYEEKTFTWEKASQYDITSVRLDERPNRKKD